MFGWNLKRRTGKIILPQTLLHFQGTWLYLFIWLSESIQIVVSISECATAASRIPRLAMEGMYGFPII